MATRTICLLLVLCGGPAYADQICGLLGCRDSEDSRVFGSILNPPRDDRSILNRHGLLPPTRAETCYTIACNELENCLYKTVCR